MNGTTIEFNEFFQSIKFPQMFQFSCGRQISMSENDGADGAGIYIYS